MKGNSAKLRDEKKVPPNQKVTPPPYHLLNLPWAYKRELSLGHWVFVRK